MIKMSRRTITEMAEAGLLENPRIVLPEVGEFIPQFNVGEHELRVSRIDGGIVSFKMLQSAKNYIVSLGFKQTDIHVGKGE